MSDIEEKTVFYKPSMAEKPVVPGDDKTVLYIKKEQPKREAQKIVLPGQTPQGEHILSVLVKRSYTIVPGKRCERAAKDNKIVSGDEYYGDPMNSTVKQESDFVPWKPATDVVLNGKAYAPAGKPVSELLASVTIGRHKKEIKVIGNRQCVYVQGGVPRFTEPQVFSEMNLIYENAYGGVDIYSNPQLPCMYPRNHLGKGYVIENKKESVQNLALPNLEDPNYLLTPQTLCVGDLLKWEQQPVPAGLGWYAKMWKPRCSFAGTMPADVKLEEEFRALYAKVLKKDDLKMYEQMRIPRMDFRYFNGASPGLAVPFLNGDESVLLENLSSQGQMSFTLPGQRPRIALDIGKGFINPEVFLHTVMIRMDEQQVDLVWRGAIPYEGPDWLPNMTKMEVNIQ